MVFKILLAMIAFATNSVLCRLALTESKIDPISFSLIRVSSGAFVLFVWWLLSKHRVKIQWNFNNGIFLAIYILAFSYAYLKIDAGIGALLLFGTVQLTMVFFGVFHGEKLNIKRGLGVFIALLGIVLLLLPGASTPDLFYSVMMIISGLAWAAYSLSGKAMDHPLSSTLANFVIAVPLILMVRFFLLEDVSTNWQGVILAILSGGLTSSVAYVLWYSIIKRIDRITASTVQLSVPCLAIVGGSLFIGEPVTLSIILSTIIVLLGILLVIFSAQNRGA